MKKLITLAAFILLLTGCSEATTFTSNLTDGKTVVASVGNASISKQDIYENLMKENGVNYVLNAALTHIADNTEIDQEALDADVKSTEDTWKAFLGDSIDSYVQAYYGYETFEEYKTEVLVPARKQVLMINQYIDDNYETLAKQYMFVKARLIIVDDQATAVTVLSDLTSEKITFEEAVETYSTDSTNKSNKGEIGLISDLSTCTVDENVVMILPQLSKVGLYSIPVQLSTGKYGILDIVETDKEVLKDQIDTELKNAEEVVVEAEGYFLKQNNFTVVDEFLKSKIEALYPSYFK